MELTELQTLSFIELGGGVGHLKLNRPKQLNAQTPEMWTELSSAVRELTRRAGMRCLIVSGEGSSFSAGFDASAMANVAAQVDSTSADEQTQNTNSWTDGFVELAQAPFATIAAIHGYALGAGLELALACDMRIVARNAHLRLPGLKYGIIPDTGAAFWLPRLVGIGRARDLLLTGREIDGEEAARIGLAEYVVDDDELSLAAESLARTIASNGSFGIAALKQVLAAALDLPFSEALKVAHDIQTTCYKSEDFIQAAGSFDKQMKTAR